MRPLFVLADGHGSGAGMVGRRLGESGWRQVADPRVVILGLAAARRRKLPAYRTFTRRPPADLVYLQ